MPQSINPVGATVLDQHGIAAAATRQRDEPRSNGTLSHRKSPLSYPYMGGAFGDRRLEVVAHSHRKQRQLHPRSILESCRQLSQSAKDRPGLALIGDERRHRHQADRMESRMRQYPVEQRRSLIGAGTPAFSFSPAS